MRSKFYLLLIVLFISNVVMAKNVEKRITIHKGGDFALGVAITDLEKEDLEKMKLEGGAEIIKVIEDSEAERIGLEDDDVIVTFDGQKVKDAEQLAKQVDKMEKPKTVKIEIKRDGKSKSFTANLKEAEGSEEKEIDIDFEKEFMDIDFEGLPDLPKKIMFKSNDKGGFLGVEADDIGEQMLDYFNVKYGVLVEAVTKDAPAEKAGLAAGDVITKVNDREIHDFSDLVRTLNFYNPGEKVTVNYVRKGKSKSVKIELAKKKGFGNMHKIKINADGDEDIIWHGDKDMKIIKKELKDAKETLKELKEIKIKLYII